MFDNQFLLKHIKDNTVGFFLVSLFVENKHEIKIININRNHVLLHSLG